MLGQGRGGLSGSSSYPLCYFRATEALGSFRSSEQPAQGGGKLCAVPALNTGAGTAVMTLRIHFTDSDAQ